nr:hypothetical protein [uncultured Allomuricauda sp.]
MRFTFTLIASLIIYKLSFSQEIFGKVEVALSFPDLKETMTVVDNHGRPNIFFVDSKEITQVIFNNDTEKIEKTFPKPPETFPKIQGFNVGSDSSINLYFSNYRSDGFFLMSIKEGEKLFVKQFDLGFDNRERFLSTINYKNQFYLLSYIEGKSIINIYSFKKAGHNKVVYDLSNHTFYNENGNVVPLSNLLDKDKTEVIEDNIPYSLEIVSKKIKIYPKNDSIIITLNHKTDRTQILSLNLKNESNKSFFIENIGASATKKSNSFISDNRLFQLIVSSEFLVLSIHDLKTREKITEYSIKKDEEFFFKNAPFYQEFEGQMSNMFNSRARSNRAEVKNTKDFLRKLSKYEVGLYILKNTDFIDITIGGAKEAKPLGVGSLLNPEILPTLISTTTDPVSWGYYSYVQIKSSIFTKSLLNIKTLKHIDKKAQNNVFDRISLKSKYLKNSVLKKKLKLETIFKIDNFFVYGFYNKKEKSYTLMKFEH